MVDNLYNKYKLCNKISVCACIFFLLAFSTTLSAQQEDLSAEAGAEAEDGVSEVTDSDQTPLTDAEKAEQYEIYRKQNPDNPCDRQLDTYDYEKNWYDDTQVYINSKFCEPALYFDNFFANDRVFQEGAAGTYIRWRNDFSYDEEEAFDFKTSISASVELPGVQSRLRLTFENDEDEDLRDIAPGSGDDSTNSLGLQLDVTETDRSKFNVSISLKPRIRFRYRYTYPVAENLTLRFTQEVQREEAVHSSRTLLDFESLFDQSYLFRSSTEGKLSEDFDGVDWLQAFVVYRRVDKKTSISYESSVNGITEPLALATNYRLGLRYRKNFHRKWLFYEIAPEMTWPVTLDEQRQEVITDRRSKWLLFFRLEVHFGNAYKKRYQDYR